MLTPTEMLNKINDSVNNDFSKSFPIKLKAGKIGFQLIAPDDNNLFKPRIQHFIPNAPGENDKWLVADCKIEDCPVCSAVNDFIKADISVDDINSAYMPKYPYKNVKSVFTQPEHYLCYAKILTDQADTGNYLPSGAKLDDTYLIQFPKMALLNLLNSYKEYVEINDCDDSLFAIFKDNDVAKSLNIVCRVAVKPYSVNFTFGKVKEIKRSEIDEDKMKLLIETPKVPAEHYDKCVERIKRIRDYFS